MREHGYSIVQLNNEWDPEIEQENFNYMMQTRVDGAIISPAHQATNFGVLGNTPFILITNSKHFSKYDTIGNDSRRGMIMALERLFELGHRRIALLAGGSMRVARLGALILLKNFILKKTCLFLKV